jgi:hypothetical protein
VNGVKRMPKVLTFVSTEIYISGVLHTDVCILIRRIYSVLRTEMERGIR